MVEDADGKVNVEGLSMKGADTDTLRDRSVLESTYKKIDCLRTSVLVLHIKL